MKNLFLLSSAFILVSCTSKLEVPKPGNAPSTQYTKMSYALGASIGNSIKQQGFDSLDVLWMARGIADVTQDSLIMTETEIQELMMAAKSVAELRVENQRVLAAAGNKAKGDAFLLENGSRPGVVTTSTGLQYEILRQGEGASPTMSSVVTVHYSGALIDGTKFDSSFDRGQPITRELTGFITGWQEGLQLMNKGAKFKLYVPSDLAYGPYSPGEPIGPGEALIFEIELLDFK